MKKIISLLFAGLVAFSTFAAPTVMDVVAKQRYPWGLVDITCKVEGIDELITDPKFVLSAVLPNSVDIVKMTKFWIIRDGVKSSNLSVDANGNYRLLWDAKADLGEVRYTNMVVRVDIKGHQKVQLWEGGPYWATTNIGAEKPKDYGYYFWWGDTVGYKRENNKWVASDGSNSNFSFSSSNTRTDNKNVATLQSEGWITADGALAPEHDAAHKHWGGDWRMPTKQEIEDLNSKCDWTWTTMNGVNGYVVRGKGDYASNTIFLPCVGTADMTNILHLGLEGGYWSSEPNPNYFGGGCASWYIFFKSSGAEVSYRNRWNGQSIRPVQSSTK